MKTVPFFMPIRFEEKTTCTQHIQEAIDDYFYLGGERAFLKQNAKEFEIRSEKNNQCEKCVLNPLKILSYIFIPPPVLMFAAKCSFRCKNLQDLILQSEELESTTHSLESSQSSDGQSFSFQDTKKVEHVAKELIYPPTPTKDLHPSPFFALQSVRELMDFYSSTWDPKSKNFDFSCISEENFDNQSLQDLLLQNAKDFEKRNIDYSEHLGFIEKLDLKNTSDNQLFVRADLHGDLLSLTSNLESLQKLELLDENFRCIKNKHLIFLGDYSDRGRYSIQVLELLVRLRQENPGQVHLIRGNHEDLSLNQFYCGKFDLPFKIFLRNPENQNALKAFYETLPLSLYIGFSSRGEKKQYFQFSHGLFELTLDPSPLLDKDFPQAYLAVPKKRTFSRRFITYSLKKTKSPKVQAAKKITSLVYEKTSPFLESELTGYNWGDVTKTGESLLQNYSTRRYQLNGDAIHSYFVLSSEKHKVSQLFRGHFHKYDILQHRKKNLVTTLPVGADCPYYTENQSHKDLAYIINLPLLKQKLIRTPRKTKGKVFPLESL